LTLSGCTLSGNSAGGTGGALYTVGYEKNKTHVFGAVTISGCTVTGNSAPEGAGFYNASAATSDRTLTINNSVFSNNGPVNQITYYGPYFSSGGNSFS
jgi:predicted outer membrane repeat protein